jgi:hypothetical protein
MIEEGLDISFMSYIAAAGSGDEKLMPGSFLLLKNQDLPTFLDHILLDGIYGTEEPGWARSDDYQIVIAAFIAPSIPTTRVGHVVFCMQIFIPPAFFVSTIELIIGFSVERCQVDRSRITLGRKDEKLNCIETVVTGIRPDRSIPAYCGSFFREHSRVSSRTW